MSPPTFDRLSSSAIDGHLNDCNVEFYYIIITKLLAAKYAVKRLFIFNNALGHFTKFANLCASW